MNHTNYTDTVRSNLCYALTAQRNNMEKLKRLNETVDMIIATPLIERPNCIPPILHELSKTGNFLKEINSVLEAEVLRLTKTILDDNGPNELLQG